LDIFVGDQRKLNRYAISAVYVEQFV